MSSYERFVWSITFLCVVLASFSLVHASAEIYGGSIFWACVSLFNYAHLAGFAVYLMLGFDKPGRRL